MKFSLYHLSFFLFFISCTKKTGHPLSTSNLPAPTTDHNCSVRSDSLLSYSTSIKPILIANCKECHSPPGSGGINIFSDSTVILQALSGNLLGVITNTDPQSIMMPPPYRRHLDSCELKQIALWVSEGCKDN
ncbi:MAG TPA: hypothetical protein PLQ93_11285 [Bacteroidia bacterium]|nr:hypothetical protein [Bacteroidia bacterium]